MIYHTDLTQVSHTTKVSIHLPFSLLTIQLQTIHLYQTSGSSSAISSEPISYYILLFAKEEVLHMHISPKSSESSATSTTLHRLPQ